MSRWRLSRERKEEEAKRQEETRKLEVLLAQREQDAMRREERYMRNLLEKEARVMQVC